MKKVLLIAALSMVAAPALASKSRLNSLQNSAHLTDVQNMFAQPWQAASNGELATVEFGSPNGTPNAEGGFVRQMGEGYLGLYLGRQSSTLLGFFNINGIAGVTVSSGGAAGTAKSLTTAEALGLSNPFNIVYAAKSGDMTWGVSFYYLNGNNKAGVIAANSATPTVDRAGFSDLKTNVMGLALGATNGVWDASATIGLAGKISGTTVAAGGGTVTWGGAAATNGQEVDFTSKSNIALQGGYTSDTLYYYGNYGMAGGKYATAGTDGADLETNTIKVGVVNSHKKDGTDFFYGIAYAMSTSKEKKSDTKVETTSLPMIVGVEAEVNSWAVLRGSLTQVFPLLGSTKTTVAGTGDAGALAHSTTVALGAGVKMNKFTLDTDLTAGTSGALSTTGYGANTSLTYAF